MPCDVVLIAGNTGGKMDINYPVCCPLMDNEEITEEICFDIHMVIEDGAPKRTAPQKIFETPNYADVCTKCPYHRKD